MEAMTPFDWTIRPVKKYAVFSGRAPRAEYWWFQLATTVVGLVLGYIGKAIGAGDWLSNIFNMALLLPILSVTVRRLHDIDRTGWWLLIFFGLFIVALL